MSSSTAHRRAAEEAVGKARDLLQTGPHHPEVSKDDYAGALRHVRNAAQQIMQAITAQAMEKREADRG